MTSRQNVWVEWLLRSVAIATYLYTITGIAISWSENAHPYNLLILLISEGFTLGLILIARCAVQRDASPLLVLATAYSSCFFLLLDKGPTTSLIPPWSATVLQVAGLALTLVAKISLGRAFGILPGARGLVTTGPYRFVRHPMYLGYFVVNIGFLLSNASVRNMCVLLALFLVQLLRIIREDALLKASDFKSDYEAYYSRVPYRLIPHIF
jgi:protein-S-isoprenylcysteine O-methyltransferase Ste14